MLSNDVIGPQWVRVKAISNNLKPVNRYRIYHQVIIQYGSSELKEDKATSDIEAARKECTTVSTVVDSDHCPDSKVRGANMGLIWGRHDPGGPHVGPMNFATWVSRVVYL